MPATVPAHHPGCETAQLTGCVCKSCRGSMHQCNILYAACWEGNHTQQILPPAFKSQVQNLFGHCFTSLSVSPTTGQKVRRGPWVLRPRTGKQRTQEEQRILDTTVADCLILIHSGAYIRPSRIYDLVYDLTLSNFWNTLIGSLKTPANRESSYFWPSMLAATSSAWHSNSALPSVADISHKGSTSPNLQKIAYPRRTAYKAVTELNNPADVSKSAEAIADALNQARLQGLTTDEIHIALWLTGAVTSPDLWHHPAAVHHCLKPLVEKLRSLGANFSLDSSSEQVEDLINFHLKNRWVEKGAW